MPLFQILPPDKESGREEHELRTIDLPGGTEAPGERVQRVIARDEEVRRDERYAALVAQPTAEEGRGPMASMMTNETAQKLLDDIAQKAAVPNVATTHSDVAKVVTGPGEVELVPTVNVYTKDDPTGEGMVVADSTVTHAGVVEGTSVLDRAETSLKQPVGDEFSARSATGPTLPEGKVLTSVAEGETVEPPHEPDQSLRERMVASADNARQAAAEADKEADKQSKALGLDEKSADTEVRRTTSTVVPAPPAPARTTKATTKRAPQKSGRRS